MTIPETYDDYLAHYGVKGMKWGVRKESDSSSSPNRKQRKENRQEAYTKFKDDYKKNVREVNAETKRLREKEGVHRSKAFGEASKNTGFVEKQDRILSEYKKTVKDNTTRGDKAREVAGKALIVAYVAAMVGEVASGGRLSESVISTASRSARKGSAFVKSFDFDNTYINPDGSRIRAPRPNFGGTTTQVSRREVTRGRRALPR